VVSPSDRASEVAEKATAWLDAGVRLVWVVDPQARLAAVHHPGGLVTVLRQDGVLDGEDVLPGFRLPLAPLLGDQSKSKIECSS
jgi:Uma2 family endonuclease